MSQRYIALLGRQPELSLAELQATYGRANVLHFTADTAVITADSIDITQLGGTIKAGRIALDVPSTDWSRLSKKVIQHYTKEWEAISHKLTLGISAYDLRVVPRQLQALGLDLKKQVKSRGGSLRLIPNQDLALGTATSHHNKLGLSDNKIELLIIANYRTGTVVVAESTGTQNITALARRDQARPRTDAFVGMLPPKLAMIMINLALGEKSLPNSSAPTILDPFCGTGTVLQEAALRGFTPYGTDLSEKMVQYSRENLDWFYATNHLDTPPYTVEQADATEATWQQPIDAVVCETYLGQPFSAPPRPEKLREVVGNCNHIITKFLQNIAPQLQSGTPLCIAVPAWADTSGYFTHLPFIDKLGALGYIQARLPLLYYREGQVVARELLVLKKT